MVYQERTVGYPNSSRRRSAFSGARALATVLKMNTPNTPREHVDRVLRAYDRQRDVGFPASDAVGITALQLRVPREIVIKALAVREARQPLRLAA